MNRLFGPDDDSIGRIHDQLAHLLKIKREMLPGAGLEKQLTREQLAVLIETAFWASVQSNEGRATRVCVTVAAPASFHDAVAFATPVAYTDSHIVKLAPAVPRGGCLVVSASIDKLSIWGIGRIRPGPSTDTVMIEASEPGSVRVSVWPFQPFSVLNGRSNAIVAGTHTSLGEYLQRILRKTPPVDDILETRAVWRECLVLAVLARMIVTDGHGGTVLIVPTEMGLWSELLSPFDYRFATPDTTIRDGIRRRLHDEHGQGELLQGLGQTDLPEDLKNLVTPTIAQDSWFDEGDVGAIASLAGVDGAIVMTRDLRVLGFGAKIAVGSDVVPQVCMFRPEPGTQAVLPSRLEDLGGTRHQSAARFTNAYRDGVALVISQDRHLSVMHWGDSFNSVAVAHDDEWWV